MNSLIISVLLCLCGILGKFLLRVYEAFFESCPVKKYKEFDKEIRKNRKDAFKEIDNFYHDGNKIQNLLEYKDFIKRKVFLLNRLNAKMGVKKFGSSFASILFSSLFCLLLEKVTGFISKFNFDTDFPIFCLLAIIFAFLFFNLFDAETACLESYQTQIYRYELCCIDKFIDKHIGENISFTEENKATDVNTNTCTDTTQGTN